MFGIVNFPDKKETSFTVNLVNLVFFVASLSRNISYIDVVLPLRIIKNHLGKHFCSQSLHGSSGCVVWNEIRGFNVSLLSKVTGIVPSE